MGLSAIGRTARARIAICAMRWRAVASARAAGSIYNDSIAINFDFVRGKRTPDEMQRLADLMRTIPGVTGYIQDLEQQNGGMHRGMKPEDVLETDAAMDASKMALREASRPSGPVTHLRRPAPQNGEVNPDRHGPSCSNGAPERTLPHAGAAPRVGSHRDARSRRGDQTGSCGM